MESRKIFPSVTDSELRSNILTQLLSTNHMIPSLYTFQEDTKYLEPCAKIIKCLLPHAFKGSVRRAITRTYTDVSQKEGNVLIQDGEKSFTLSPGGELSRFYFGYRQLWLYAMRHFPEMIGIPPLKDTGRPKPPVKERDEDCWNDFAQLAFNLGFRSQEIQGLRRGPDNSTIREDSRSDLPDHSVDVEGEPISRRCGKPYLTSHEFDKKYLFPISLYTPTRQSPKQGITSS